MHVAKVTSVIKFNGPKKAMKTLFENAKTQFKKLMHVAKFTPVIKFNGPKKSYDF